MREDYAINYKHGGHISPRNVAATQTVVKFKLASLIKLQTQFQCCSETDGHDQ